MADQGETPDQGDSTEVEAVEGGSLDGAAGEFEVIDVGHISVQKIEVDSDRYGYDRDRHQDGVRKRITYGLVGLFGVVEIGRIAAAMGAMAWADGTWANVQGEVA